MTIIDGLIELIANRKYNRELYKSGAANRNEIRQTAVGWQPGGFTPDPGNDCIVGVDEVTGKYIYDTPSGNVEYYKVIRRR